MITSRIKTNVAVFLAASALLVYLGATRLVLPAAGGRTLEVGFVDAAGLLPRNDVTMRGVPVGAIRDVELGRGGLVRVTVALEPGITVPEGTTVQINRRSPIGDLVLELTPGDGPALPDGAYIGPEHTVGPPDAERTIEILTRVLGSVSPQDVATVVRELAAALRGRGSDLATLAEAGADLPERILRVQRELESLITTGPEVTGVFAAHAETLADDITQTALLADILRDRRFDLVALSENGARFAEVAGALLASQKANLACLVSDFGRINDVLAGDLEDLAATLDLNHFFFDGVEQAVVPGKDGLTWFRVQLLSHQEPAGRAYAPQRPPPDVLQGNGCHSRFGDGVGPGTQPGPAYLARGSELHPGS